MISPVISSKELNPMKFALENLGKVKEDIKPLIEEHWEEIALDKGAIKLNPDWDAYGAYDFIGSLRVYTARENGQLMGYFVVLVSKSLHYKDHTFANNDIIFLKKEARQGLTGLKLIKYAIHKLEAEGVSKIHINTKIHQPFDVVLERLGFSCIERIYSKCLR